MGTLDPNNEVFRCERCGVLFCGCEDTGFEGDDSPSSLLESIADAQEYEEYMGGW
jgi:hypothetical protein